MYERSHETSSSDIYQISTDTRERTKNVGLRLLGLADKCRSQGMSGRSLRRLPVLALARFIGLGLTSMPVADNGLDSDSVAPEVEGWLAGMERVVEEKGDELQHLSA